GGMSSIHPVEDRLHVFAPRRAERSSRSVREAPTQREQAIELDANRGIVGDPAPRERAVEAADHLAGLAAGILVRSPFVAGLSPLALGEVCYGICSSAPELIGEVCVVHLDLLDDGPELADDFESDFVSNEHVRVLPFVRDEDPRGPGASGAAGLSPVGARTRPRA